MTLKEILNQVLLQSEFLARGSFTDSPDVDDKQMTAIANRVAYEIMNWFAWPELRTSSVISMSGDETRYKLPGDFQDVMPDSAWELDGERMVEWPVPDGRWFMYKFTSISDGGTFRIRRYGDEIEVHDPTTDSGFRFEYLSKWPVVSSEGERKEYFTNDNDTFLLDDQLLVIGIQAHWQLGKGMPAFQLHMENYKNKMREAIGRSVGGMTIGGVYPGGGPYSRHSPYYNLWRP